jgi:RNA polymerase sigma-70 factor (ECF subfamily)
MRDKLKEYRSIEALAITMTRNHCIDRLRKKGRELYEDARPIDTRTDDMDPHRDIENKDSYRRIITIIGDLPEKYRTIIEMRDINGYSYDEIENELGENINTIRVNLSRARKMVREKLIKLNYEPART